MRHPARRHARRAAVIVYLAVSITVIAGFAALVIDLGVLSTARTQSQVSADAAAMAGANKLLDDRRLRGSTAFNQVLSNARAAAVTIAHQNQVMNAVPVVSSNSSDNTTGDIVLGYLSDPYNSSNALSFNNLAKFNSVQVRIRRDPQHGGSIATTFAHLFHHDSANVGAKATATFQDGIVGFRDTSSSGNAMLLPFALHINIWNQLLAGTRTTGDSYNYNPANGTVTAGADGIKELNLYPGSGGTQLPAGNFGTVDIGSPNNSTADLSRQIRYGVNAHDMSYFPNGEVRLGSNGTLILNGDTGISAAIKDDLAAIIGQPRIIPLFNAVSGNGNNSHYTIVGFAGVRILYVRLTGSASSKQVIIQPAIVTDRTAIAQGGSNTSTYVYRPVMLSR